MYHKSYDEDFKKSIVTLIQAGKTQSQVSKEYGISISAINNWVKLYGSVENKDEKISNSKQIQEVQDLQKQIMQLEEENLILKKALAIFTKKS